MSDITIQVIHSLPGRIRVKLPWLKHNFSDQETLQQVQSLGAVKTVRVNPAARSLTVHYDADQISEAAFSMTLITALQANHPDATTSAKESRTTPQPGHLPPDCEVIQLTAYERSQFEDILAWKHRKISGFKQLTGQVLLATQGLLNFLLVNKALEKVVSICESVTRNWQQDWEKLKPVTGVDAAISLRQGFLERCDHLSESVRAQALQQAAVQGSIGGLFDVFGEVADEGLTLALALQTIHRIGLCYGYQPQTPDEQAFAWAIFNAANSITQAEFEQTQITIRALQRSLNKNALEDEALEDTLEENVSDLLIDSAIEQGLAQLTGETLGGIIPVVSILTDIFADRDLIEQVSEAAKREFQQRWLLENRKIRFPELAV